MFIILVLAIHALVGVDLGRGVSLPAICRCGERLLYRPKFVEIILDTDFGHLKNVVEMIDEAMMPIIRTSRLSALVV
jgi:hypothetical protein